MGKIENGILVDGGFMMLTREYDNKLRNSAHRWSASKEISTYPDGWWAIAAGLHFFHKNCT